MEIVGHFFGMFSLKGKTAIVTGAGRGIGKDVSGAFAEAGAKVVALDINAEAAHQTAEEVKRIPAKSLAVAADVTSETDLKEASRVILKTLGKIDILFNNAGIQVVCPAEKMSLSDWQEVIDINLTGIFLCCRIFGADMINRQKGKIINMTSIHGLTASGLHPAISYNASKAGVINLTRSLATEWGKYGINVNAIAPGLVKTELTEKRLDDSMYYTKIIERVPLKKIMTSRDLFGAIIFLASEASDMITGQTLVIDGGWLSHS